MKSPTLLVSIVVVVVGWSSTTAAQNTRPVLLTSACCAPEDDQRLSEGVRREVARRLSPTRPDLPAVSLDVTWEWRRASAPGPWIDEPCSPQPSFETPPALTEHCGRVRGSPSTRRVLGATALVAVRACTIALGPVRGSEKDVRRRIAKNISEAVGRLDRSASCSEAGWNTVGP